jgi:hypothetical protein
VNTACLGIGEDDSGDGGGSEAADGTKVSCVLDMAPNLCSEYTGTGISEIVSAACTAGTFTDGGCSSATTSTAFATCENTDSSSGVTITTKMYYLPALLIDAAVAIYGHGPDAKASCELSKTTDWSASCTGTYTDISIASVNCDLAL